MQIVAFFPPPAPPIRIAITALRTMAEPVTGETPAQKQDRLDRLAELPRPWIPASCEPDLQLRLWRWLDDVASWFNDQYSWQPRSMIPPCWPRHPHITHELAELAIRRYLAELAIEPALINEWHRWDRPLFVERMQAQLGDGCRNDHNRWPGHNRFDDFTGNSEQRSRTFSDSQST